MPLSVYKSHRLKRREKLPQATTNRCPATETALAATRCLRSSMCGFTPFLNYYSVCLSRASPADGIEAAFHASACRYLGSLSLWTISLLFLMNHRGHNLYPMNTDRLRAMYPTLTDSELKEAEENLSRYFACVLQIASEAHPAPVDSSERPVTIKERSSSSLNNIPFEHG